MDTFIVGSFLGIVLVLNVSDFAGSDRDGLLPFLLSWTKVPMIYENRHTPTI